VQSFCPKFRSAKVDDRSFVFDNYLMVDGIILIAFLHLAKDSFTLSRDIKLFIAQRTSLALSFRH